MYIIIMLPIHPQLQKQLDTFCDNKTVPNIIFHGSSGSGKKTIVLNFVSRIYNNNKKIIKENVLFINCSQDKGIKYIREELKTFAKYNIHISHDIPFKTIIMLNFDNLSNDAQSVMRRIIEIFINTRFFIIVENKNKLLNPIISRFCSIYIPEHIIDSKIINLHKYHLELSLENKTLFQKDVITDILLHIHEKNAFYESARLYEMGISCYDIINVIKSGCITNILEKTKSEILMKYYILKKEYRCEKLLMFHIFTFLQKE